MNTLSTQGYFVLHNRKSKLEAILGHQRPHPCIEKVALPLLVAKPLLKVINGGSEEYYHSMHMYYVKLYHKELVLIKRSDAKKTPVLFISHSRTNSSQVAIINWGWHY
jgi:hypothetical protein